MGKFLFPACSPGTTPAATGKLGDVGSRGRPREQGRAPKGDRGGAQGIGKADDPSRPVRVGGHGDPDYRQAGTGWPNGSIPTPGCALICPTYPAPESRSR